MKTKSRGDELAKVLWYYNLIPDVSVNVQKIVCPFHEDVNPSMIVNFDEGSWFCFGCNLSGDALRFVKLMEAKYNGLNELQSCKKFVEILKSRKCSAIHVEPSSMRNAPTDRDLYNEAYDYYHGLRKVNWITSDDEEVVEAKRYMKRRGFNPQTLNKCSAKITYSKNYSIIFPMLDNGKFRGWVCRTTLKSVEARRKYLYNKGFSRATTLVGNYGSKDYVIVVEGYMDRLKFVQYGVENVVAILGWKMSADQIRKLKQKGVTKVISALDNDKCGRKGTEFLKGHFEVTRFAYLKGVKDPGEMTEETFNKMFRRTMNNFYGGK